jgi:hypothetical protein
MMHFTKGQVKPSDVAKPEARERAKKKGGK